MDRTTSIGMQQPDNGEILITHSVLLLLLLFAFMVGYYAASRKWPENNRTSVDTVIALPFAIFCVWMLIPRFALAGEKVIPALAAGNTDPITSLFLCFGLLMILGMSFYFTLPKLKESLAGIGSQLTTRVERAIAAIFGSDDAR